MSESTAPLDLVITYSVQRGENSDEYKKVGDALEKGYRIIDVVQTAANTGGNYNHIGDVVVTVVLTRPSPASSGYRWFQKQG